MIKQFMADDPKAYEMLVTSLIMLKQKLICCTYQNKEKGIVVAERACRYETDEEPFAKAYGCPVYVDYELTLNEAGKYKYNLHDGMSMAIKNGMAMKRLFDAMIDMYDVFIVVDEREPEADFYNIYGKIGTEKENTVIFTENH